MRIFVMLSSLMRKIIRDGKAFFERLPVLGELPGAMVRLERSAEEPVDRGCRRRACGVGDPRRES